MAQAAARPSRIRRRTIILVIAGLILLFVILGALSGFYIDILWFREARLSSVFWSVFWSRAVLAVTFGVLFFAILYANLLIVRRFTPRYRLFSPEQEVIDRYRSAFDPYMRWILPALSALFAIFAAGGVAGYWQRFLLWKNGGGVSFGQLDPVFHRDAAFYVFNLPFLHFVQGWLFSSLVVVTVVTAAFHYLWGGIRFQAIGEKVTPVVKAHLSVLLGLIVLVKAWGYRLGQFDLLTSERGVVTGASYTDIHAQLPALKLLVPIAIVCAVLFLVNIRFRGWALPVLGIGLLALASIVAGAAFPAFVQKFRVSPQELQQERPFIDRNIKATRLAFGLAGVDQQPLPIEADLTKKEVQDNPDTVSNIRLWSPSVLQNDYDQLQQIRRYYAFRDVDVDRYTLPDGNRRVVMISGREITQNGIPSQRATWQNKHLFFTHGFGFVASRVDRVTSEGQPDFLVKDIPPTGIDEGDLAVNEPPGPRIYFGETKDVPFVVTRTGANELDRPESGTAEATTRYSGQGGIPMSGFFRKLAFAWRYRDVNLLISNLITSDSRILINRDITTRVQKAAPFLKFDHDPYLAVVDGRLVWIWDAYTYTDAYPYSERVDLEDATDGAQRGRVNYLRNSVKVVIDAYDGTMRYYVIDPSDPIIQVWQKIFPDLFTPGSEVSTNLRAHFRYPEDLFTVQSEQYANYHVTNPSVFYSGDDFWGVPDDPAARANGEGTKTLEPYYVLMRLPGQTEEQFVLFSPFTPVNRPNMIAWMAANSDPEAYGQLTAFEFPSGTTIPGPEQVASRINQDPIVSPQITLLGRGGSRVRYGNLLAIPVGDSFLYVQPLYVESESTGGRIPELKRVVAVHGENVTIGTTLQEALSDSFGGAVTPPTEPGQQTPSQTVEQLLASADSHFRRADTLLRQGDLAGYASEIAAARADLEKALRQSRGGGAAATPTPSASPSA